MKGKRDRKATMNPTASIFFYFSLVIGDGFKIFFLFQWQSLGTLMHQNLENF